MRLVITGDRARYQFFRNMLNGLTGSKDSFFTEKLGERDIYLTSDRQKIAENVYYSKKLPLNTLVFFPKEYENITLDYKSTDKIIVFDEFPYATDKNIENVDKIMESGEYCQIEVVIFKNNREYLESDISTDDMAVNEAKKIYSKKGISVYTYSINDRPDFLFWTSLKKITGIKQVFQPIVNQVKNNIATFDSIYECNFDIYNLSKLTDFDILASFFKFQNNLIKKNVWDIYYTNSFNYYWIDNIEINMFYTDLYKDAITDLCLWDLDYDINSLSIFIRKQYKKELTIFEPLFFNEEKEKYDEFLNCHRKEVLNFKLKIKNFFSVQLKDILKRRIIRNVERMEELMK